MKEYKVTIADDGTPSIALVPTPVDAKDRPVRGINLAGGEYYYANVGSGNPVKGKDYLFPSAETINSLHSRGYNFFRLLFSWESYHLDQYRSELFEAINTITGLGDRCMLDIHGGNKDNFASLRGDSVKDVSVATSLAHLWSHASLKLREDPLVSYGLMNEPWKLNPAEWFTVASMCSKSIRNTNSSQVVYAPGSAWTSASTWVSSGNSLAVSPQLISGKNNRLQVHLYLDADASGRTNSIAYRGVGVSRLKGVTSWARSNRARVLLSELGLYGDKTQAQLSDAKYELDSIMDHLNSNSDVWDGVVLWTAGNTSWWGKHRHYAGPGSFTDSLLSDEFFRA
jgi:endoglucanase